MLTLWVRSLYKCTLLGQCCDRVEWRLWLCSGLSRSLRELRVGETVEGKALDELLDQLV
jgi:hypothetical protein